MLVKSRYFGHFIELRIFGSFCHFDRSTTKTFTKASSFSKKKKKTVTPFASSVNFTPLFNLSDMLASSKGYCTTLVAVICTVLMGIGMQQNIFRVSSRFDSHCAATNALFGISSPFNSLCAATNALFGVETSGATIIGVGGTPNLLQKVTSAAPGATKNKDYPRPNTVPPTDETTVGAKIDRAPSTTVVLSWLSVAGTSQEV